MNMNIGDIFPSNYLKASDLKGRQVTVKIARIEMETIGQGKEASHKPVIYFEGKEKGLVANKTNMNMIASVCGQETDDWIGLDIILFEAMVDYQGQTKPAIRVRVPPRKVVRDTSPPPVRNVPDPVSADPDDEIPF